MKCFIEKYDDSVNKKLTDERLKKNKLNILITEYSLIQGDLCQKENIINNDIIKTNKMYNCENVSFDLMVKNLERLKIEIKKYSEIIKLFIDEKNEHTNNIKELKNKLYNEKIIKIRDIAKRSN